MSDAFAYAITGAVLAIGSVAFCVWRYLSWLKRRPEHALVSLSILVRVLARSSGYQSFVVAIDAPTGAEPVVVSFEQVASAIEHGELRSGLPVRIRRSDYPPPLPDHYDGRA